MGNMGSLKVSKNFKKFLRKLQAYRISEEVDEDPMALCNLPDIIVKYFKENNDRYLELVGVEVKNGNN